jgi:hypothetical protein
MKKFNALLGLVFLTILPLGIVHLSLAQDTATTEKTGALVNAYDYLIPFLLMVPGLLGLLFATVKDKMDQKTAQDSSEEDLPENQFSFALFAAISWILILLLLALLGTTKLHFFDQKLQFGFSVPILGFLGAMLFVLDMFRKGRKDIQRGKELGIRIIMGPYMAIVMVLLFAGSMGLANSKDVVKTASIAFFSGLLVVYAFQILVEMGQEFLGNLRRKTRYEPSEIAAKFKLEKDDDAKLRTAGITHLFQLKLYEEGELKSKAITVKIDEKLLIGIKRKYEEELLEEDIGTEAWKELKKNNINNLETFAMVKEEAIDAIAAGKDFIDGDQLKKVLHKAKDLILRGI